jgi:hypothetical protein
MATPPHPAPPDAAKAGYRIYCTDTGCVLVNRAAQIHVVTDVQKKTFGRVYAMVRALAVFKNCLKATSVMVGSLMVSLLTFGGGYRRRQPHPKSRRHFLRQVNFHLLRAPCRTLLLSATLARSNPALVAVGSTSSVYRRVARCVRPTVAKAVAAQSTLLHLL